MLFGLWEETKVQEQKPGTHRESAAEENGFTKINKGQEGLDSFITRANITSLLAHDLSSLSRMFFTSPGMMIIIIIIS